MNYQTVWPQFFTASTYQKFHLLKQDNYKDIIINSLKFLMPLAGSQAAAAL